MKSSCGLSFALACVVVFFAVSCSTGPLPQTASQTASQTAPPQVSSATPSQSADTSPQPTPEPQQPAEVTPRPAASEPATDVQKPAATPKPAVERQPFQVSQETYSKTFDEVEKVINALNAIISDGSFGAWTAYLTREYVDEMSKTSTLRQISESPILKRNNIVLNSLEDYFRFVVVPSRSNARLDDLVFLDENTVDAIMVVRGQRVILYQLEKREGKWKIGLF